MNQIEKILKTLSSKNREIFILLMEQIEKDHTKIPGIKKLSGKSNYFRIRVGQYRLIFQLQRNGDVIYHRLSKRDEQTYKNL